MDLFILSSLMFPSLKCGNLNVLFSYNKVELICMLIIQIAFDFIETGSFDLQLAVKLEST